MRSADRSRVRWFAPVCPEWTILPYLLVLLGACLAPAWGVTPAASVECPAARSQVLYLPMTRMAVSRGDPIVIVAFGSSSTEGAGASAPDRTYPARLEALLREAWPGQSVRVLNRGRGGQTTPDMLARLEDDVLSVSPTLLIWQEGANAALRNLDPKQFAELVHEGVRATTARGIDVVLMDNQIAPRILARPGHAVYNEILAREAARSGVSLFSRSALMREWAEAEPFGQPMIGDDGLHHTDRGYACLAAALARAIKTAAAAD